MVKRKTIGIILLLFVLIFIVIGILLFFITRTVEPDFGGSCGDDICGFGETSSNCIEDCDVNKPPVEFCGDGICQSSESKSSCSNDCGLNLPICGNNLCQVFNFPQENIFIDEFISCPSDCGIICGDRECVIDPFDERLTCEVDCGLFGDVCGDNLCELTESIISCPVDCPFIDNSNLINQLNQKQRPLVGGLSIQMPRGNNFALCTLGAIVDSGGEKFILTAGHCVTEGVDGFPDPNDIGLQIRQGEEIVGNVKKTDFSGGVDAALISINFGIPSKQENFLGDEINGFGTNSDIFEGQRVFKVGRSTGLTFGKITECPTCNTKVEYTDINGNKIQGFTVQGDSSKFSESGDSGSAIITVSKPHKIVGIISAGDGSNLPNDIKDKLGL